MRAWRLGKGVREVDRPDRRGLRLGLLGALEAVMEREREREREREEAEMEPWSWRLSRRERERRWKCF